MRNFYLFCPKKPTFCILHTHFYKTPISVCLFYHLFYLNNHFPHFFLIIYLNPLSPFPVLNSLSIHGHKQRSKHQSTTVETRRSTSTDLPQAPIHRDLFQLTQTFLSPPQAPRLVLVNFQAPTHSHKFTKMLSLLLLVCPCVGVFNFG